MYIDNVHAYFADTQFYEWMPAAEEDPAFKPVFDLTLALASARAEKIETHLEEYFSLNGGLDSKDYKRFAFLVVKSTMYRPGLIDVVKEFLKNIASNNLKSIKIRIAASNVLALSETIAEDPLRLTFGHVDRLSLGEIVALASAFANCHTHQDVFHKELKRAIKRGLDDVTFQRLANRATRIVGYPVAMNAYIAYAHVKQFTE